MSGKYALVFGNTDYIDPALAKLTAPGRDAQDLARVLQDPALCGFDDVHVAVNTPSSSAIEAIDEFFDGRKPDDLLVLYFSGHGIRDELGSLYLAFTNTVRTRLRSTALKAEYIREAMDESRSKRQVLVLDCCNSGAFPPGTKAELGGTMGLANALQGYGRYVLTASDATQFAWEGDRLIGQTENSLFTHFLVKGLEGEADRDSDGAISVDDLYDYTFEQISRVTPKQTPTKSASKQEGEIVLRQITRLQDIRPVTLPDDLLEAIADSRTFVREGAVAQLQVLLSGRNLGLARSAREALEALSTQDDSLRVRKAAGDVLAPIMAAEKEASAKAAEQNAAAGRAVQQEIDERLHKPAQVEAAQVVQLKTGRDTAKPAQPGEIKEEVHELEAAHARLARQELGSLTKLLRGRSSMQQAAAGPRTAIADQKTAQAAAGVRPYTAPRWRSVLWIVLGFVVSSLLTNYLPFPVAFNLALYGALTGLTVAGVFYVERTLLLQWKSILGLAVGWALAWTISGLFAQYLADIGWDYGFSYRLVFVTGLSGGIAGAVLALVLFLENRISRWQDALGFIVAWGLGGAVDGLSLQVLYWAVFSSNDLGFAGATLSGTILDALVGGLITIWLLRRVRPAVSSQQAAAS